jgi:hypothetical protein
MEGREEEAAAASLDGDETEGSHAEAMVSGEVVQQPTAGAVGADLIVDVKEKVGRKNLDLEAGLVVDPMSTGEVGAMLVAQPVVEKTATLGKRLLGGRGYLGKMDILVLPGDHVPGTGDADKQVVVLVLDLARGDDVKQLGVQGPPVELKDQVADRWSDKEN